MRNAERLLAGVGLIALAVLMVITMSACKRKTGTPVETDLLTLEAVSAVMGKAGAQTPGVSEVNKTDGVYEINYHLYLSEHQDFDALVGSDLVPKIEKLYKTFGTLDKVTFSVETPDPANSAAWRDNCSFEMTRQIYNQTNWTNLLARDLFKICKVKYSR